MNGLVTLLARLGWRYAIASLGLAALIAVLLAIPTAILDTPLFTRMTPVESEQYVIWVLTSVMTGALLATFTVSETRPGIATQSARAGLLGVFAIGCPICNKLVVALLGTSGALNYFAPVQPLIGVAAVGLTGWALSIRYRTLRDPSCPLPGPVR
jgi:hypothetical protein